MVLVMVAAAPAVGGHRWMGVGAWRMGSLPKSEQQLRRRDRLPAPYGGGDCPRRRGAAKMPQPRLTFACELSSERLDDLSADRSIIAGLRALDSRVALALAAFTPERAGVVRR